MKKLLASLASAVVLLGAAGSATAATATVPGYDSVTLSSIPANAHVVAGYVGGMWPTYDQVVQRFPHAEHVSIAIDASELTHDGGKPVNCLDIEPGDATVAQARAWDLAEIRLGEKHPCDYTMLSMMGQLRAAVAGLPVLLWVAAYDGNSGLIGYDAHQWTDVALGRSLDADTFSLTFLQDLGLAPQPASVLDIGGAEHYEDYATTVWVLHGQSVRERNTVEAWDRHGCENPVKRPVCRYTRQHLTLLLARDQTVLMRYTPAQDVAFHLDGRIQGLVHRLAGRGVVRAWS